MDDDARHGEAMGRRTAFSADISAGTGIDEDMIRHLAGSFHDKLRADPVLEPIFAARILFLSNGERLPARRPDTIAPSGALHGLNAGAIALMTLAAMTRTCLGHTGRPLTATRPIQLIYGAAIIAALTRIIATFGIARDPMLHTAAKGWVLAFVGFAFVYRPLLTRPRA
jgi:uncharacterized protein involved in response to NO